MEAESVDSIDVEVVTVESCQAESIQFKWIKAAEAQYQTRLGKSAFQQAITRLVNKYNCPLHLLRRGEARNTEYSSFAVELLKLLSSGDERKLREALLNLSPDVEVSGSGALIIATKNNQIAMQQDLAADGNFKSAKTNLSGAMANFRALGRSYGKKVVKEFEAGFAEEVDEGLKDLGVQIESTFKAEE